MRAFRQLFGVVGSPIAHSLSPLLHNLAFEALGFKGSYHAWHVETPSLAGFVHAVRLLPISGASVTLPHKEKVLPLLDEVSALASKVGAVNTLHWQDEKLCGHNTDVEGFLAPLEPFNLKHVLVLGAGGVARAAMVGLLTLPNCPEVVLCSRTLEKSNQLVQDMLELFPKAKLSVSPWEDRADLNIVQRPTSGTCVVNCTPVGLSHGGESLLNFTLFSGSGPRPLAYDLIYHQTPFLCAASQAGWDSLNGLPMFLAQAQGQFRLWTGRDMPRKAVDEFLRHIHKMSI